MAEDILTTSMNALKKAIEDSITTMVRDTVVLIPKLIAATIIFIIGYGIAVVLSKLVHKILYWIKLDVILKEHKVEDALAGIDICKLLARLVKWYVALIFLREAVAIMALGTISDFINKLLTYFPVFIGASLITIIAAIIGELVKDRIMEIEEFPFQKFFAISSKIVIVFLGVMVALSTMGFDTTIINQTFNTILQGVIYGVALAVGISFGLGGQEDAKEIIKKVRSKLHI